MILIPRGRFIALFFMPLLIAAFGLRFSSLFVAALYLDLLILFIALVDILGTLTSLRYDFELEQGKPFSIGRINHLDVAVVNRSRLHLRIILKLALPKWIEDETKSEVLEVQGLSEYQFTFALRPTRRGSFPVEYLFTRAYSKYRFFYLDQKHKIDYSIDVYPDIKQLNHFLKLTKNNRDYKMGINKNRWIGNGTELESLREYNKDDDSKFIDWKASTRLNRPISKVFQSETNNQVMIAIDCGRLMTAEQKGINTLDHAVNSLLVLSHIAFNAGDTVNIVAFSDRIIDKTPPLKGRDSIKKITKFITKLDPEFVESNYSLLFSYLEQYQQKRALIIIITDMIDDINYELFKKRINRLSKKHLLILVLMQDTLLSKHADDEVHNVDELFIRTSGREMLLQRSKAISRLKQCHVNVLDVLPHELTGPLVNKYLEIKAKNRL